MPPSREIVANLGRATRPAGGDDRAGRNASFGDCIAALVGAYITAEDYRGDGTRLSDAAELPRCASL